MELAIAVHVPTRWISGEEIVKQITRARHDYCPSLLPYSIEMRLSSHRYHQSGTDVNMHDLHCGEKEWREIECEADVSTHADHSSFPASYCSKCLWVIKVTSQC